MTEAQVELLVVGAGPAGIAAACTAAESGVQVAVLDDNPDVGGQIWRGEKRSAPSSLAAPWLERAAKASGIQWLTGWAAVGPDGPHALLALPPGGGQLVRVAYQKLVLATGARELFLPVPGWTLPGVFGAGGLQALVKGGWSVAERRIVVAGSGPLLLAVAAYLQQTGADVVLVAEQAPWSKVSRYAMHLLLTQFAKFRQGVRLRRTVRSTPYRVGCWPVRILGREQVEAVIFSDGVRRFQESCDLLACGFGLVPNTELGELLGCQRAAGRLAVDRWQRCSVPHVYAAGEVCGIAGVECALVEGQIAGYHASGNLTAAGRLCRKRDRLRRFAGQLHQAFALRDELRSVPDPHTIVCRCEDVTLGQVREQMSWRAARLQQRCGMGLCQGRICGPALEFLFGWKDRSIRPPLFPVPLGALADEMSPKSDLPSSEKSPSASHSECSTRRLSP
ncbi:MAG: oxidoreductase [Pirellulaceae bacterium]|nr:MAG: oxidoreductase [Pirellulaceae bacterium]